MKPKLFPPEFVYVMANPIDYTKRGLSKCDFLTRCGLYENFVIHPGTIPQICSYVDVIFLSLILFGSFLAVSKIFGCFLSQPKRIDWGIQSWDAAGQSTEV